MQWARNSGPLILVAALASAGVADAQDRAFVRLDTNYPEAILYADSVRIGNVSSSLIAVPASSRILRLVPPGSNTWSVTPVSRPFAAHAGDTVEVSLRFPYHYRIESIPFDADVHVEWGPTMQRIGSTPLLYKTTEPVQGRFVVEHAGYAMERIAPGREIWNRHVVKLSPSDDLDPTAAEVQWKPPRKHRAWIDYAALGTALAAGALAVHYKFKADELYARYEDSGDASLRPEIKSFDRRSGIAFGVMQGGLGIFAIRLVLR